MLWQIVQGLGALVGLVTGIFVLWERLTRHRPEAFIIAIPFADGGTRFSYLRVANPNSRPILLDVLHGPVDGEMRISEDHSTRSIVRSVVAGKSMFVVGGNATMDFPVFKPPDFDEMEEDHEMSLPLRWRFAQPKLWRGWRNLSISMSKRSYKALASDYFEDETD